MTAAMLDVSDLETVYYSSRGRRRQCPVWESWGTARWKTCKCRACPRCGRSWARSWETVTTENLRHYRGSVAIVTVTAPGVEVLPWACGHDHLHSGKIGCRVEDGPADLWSEGCRRNWQMLRDAAMASVRRAGLPTTSLYLARAWEPQKRGVPHLHLVVGIATPEEKAAAVRFADELARLAPEYGFGFVDRKLAAITAREAARYVSGYLLGRSARKGTIRSNISDPRMPLSLVYVARSLTKETFVTMRRLRYVRWYFAALAGRVPIFPRIEDAGLRLEVARVCALLDRRGPPRKAEQHGSLVLEHMRNLRLMVDLTPAFVA